jgi:glutamyl-tRNA reductase
MRAHVCGISHHSCPVEVREKFSFGQSQQQELLHKLHNVPDVAEAMILSTCNRLEFYIYCSNAFDAAGCMEKMAAEITSDGLNLWRKYGYHHSGLEAVEHLFNVAAGLDSQVMCEGQILAQLKSAYGTAIHCKSSRFMFHKLMHAAFHVGKAVREQCGMNGQATSVGASAVEAAGKLIDLRKTRAIVVGAGENAQVSAKYLVKKEIGELLIANRNIQGAQAIVDNVGYGRAIALDDLYEYLPGTELVISTTAAAEPVIKYGDVKKALSESGKQIIFFDIAVPRDIEAQVGQIKNVRLFNIDDLDTLAVRDTEKYRVELEKARNIVAQHVGEFGKWLDTLNIVPVISELTQKLSELAKAEARRYATTAQVDPDKLEQFAQSLARKILHGPIAFMKNAGDEPTFEQVQVADLLNRIFLEDKDGGQ